MAPRVVPYESSYATKTELTRLLLKRLCHRLLGRAASEPER